MISSVTSIVAKLFPRTSGLVAPALPDKRLRLFGIITVRAHLLIMPMVFIPLVSYWLIGPAYFNNIQTFLLASLLNYSLTLCCVLTLDNLTERVILRYPDLNQSLARAVRVFLVFFLVTPLFLLLGIFIYSYFQLFGYQHAPGLTLRILLYNVGVNLLSTGIDETVYSLRKWKENALEREELQKANIQSQYESLKHQVNPHFLFNSLNSLSSLIADEPAQAEQFVDEMAKVYRYLLQTNSNPSDHSNVGGALTSLEAELGFIESYFHLLKTRYRTGIELRINVDKRYRNYKLPPLALQMLVENAVKHNIVAARQPLVMEIFVEEEGSARKLMVRNNLQPKHLFSSIDQRHESSNGVGLANIKTKYRLLNRNALGKNLREPLILRDDKYFTVVLPLFFPVNV